MLETVFSFRNLLLLTMLISGSFGTLFSNFQNSQLVYEGTFYKNFFHPYMQTLMMFIAEALSLPVHHFMKKRDPDSFRQRKQEAVEKGLKLNVPLLYLAVPSFLDFITSTLQYTALNFISASVYQMMKGGTVVTTFFFSICFLKMIIRRHQIVGSAMALVGILTVGASNVIFMDHDSEGGSSADLQIIGMLLIAVSLMASGFQFVYEQKLYTKYHIEPTYMVGVEGLFGVGIYALILPVLTHLPCPFGVNACAFSESARPYFERPDQFLRELLESPFLLTCVILGIAAVCLFNISGNAITKYINALARTICDISRSAFVWLLAIVITITLGDGRPNYRWQILDIAGILMEAFGFVVLIMGNLIYNRIVKIPCLGGTDDYTDGDEQNLYSTKADALNEEQDPHQNASGDDYRKYSEGQHQEGHYNAGGSYASEVAQKKNSKIPEF